MSRDTAADQAALESRRVERVYAALAGVYDGFFDWALGPGRRAAVRRLDPDPGDRVLEVGVGTGLSLPEYPEHCRVVGIDISEAMLERARARLEGLSTSRVELLRMDARALDFPEACFDRVFVPYVMSVVPEPGRVMAEIRRVCKPGGKVIVVNHFGSAGRFLGTLERWLSALTQWIGFRLDLPLNVVTGTAGLETLQVDRINLLGLWRLIELRRVGGGDPG